MKGLTKKIISGLLSTALLAVCATSLTACKIDETPKTTNSSFNYETDMQYMYYASGRFAPITKSDTGYYYVGGQNMIIYVDKESQKATPLCSKPNCLHTGSDSCDAYFELATTMFTGSAMGVPIQYYKGNLYMLTREWTADGAVVTHLIKTDKAGKNREKIIDALDYSAYKWMIHRGYFYYATDFSVKRIPLDKPKSEPEQIYTLDKNKSYEGNNNAFSDLIAYGEYVYFDATERDVENNTSGDTIRYAVNTSTMEVIKLQHQDKNIVIDTFYDDHLVSYTYNVKTDEKPVYYKSNLDGSDLQTLTGENFNKVHNYYDGKYYYRDNEVEAFKNNEDQIIEVYDDNSKKIDSFKIKEGKGTKPFFAQDEDYFIFLDKDENGDEELVLADKSQIGNINGGVIEWKSLCKYMWYEVPDVSYIVSSGKEHKPDNATIIDNQ